MAPSDSLRMEWKPIVTAPFDRDLEVAVIDYDGTHALVFPCRRFLHGWINAENANVCLAFRMPAEPAIHIARLWQCE